MCPTSGQSNRTSNQIRTMCDPLLKIYSRAFKLSNHFRKMHSHENELFQDVPGVKKPRLKYVMGDDGYYKLNDYGFQLHRIDFLY